MYIKTGEFVWDATDLSITGRKLSVNITRTYSNQHSTVGPFGYGWDFSYNMYLIRYPDKTKVQFFGGTGSGQEYSRDSGDTTKYVLAGAAQYFKRDDANNIYTLIKPDGFKYEFNTSDRLHKAKDVFNNTITFDYNSTYQSRIDKITDDIGRQIKFTFDSNGLIASITDFTNRQWVYKYDNNDLVAVTGPNTPDYPEGLTSTYSYENHNMVSLVNPNEDEIFHCYYDAQDRAIRQDHDDAVFIFDHDSPNATITTTDREGYTIEQIYNTNGQLTSSTAYTKNPNDNPNHFTTTYSYDTNGMQVGITYPGGNCIDYTYDSNSRRTGTYQKTSPSEPNDRDDPDVLATTYTYDTTWYYKIRTETDPCGNVITNDYNSVNGSLEKITYPTVATINGNETPTTTFTYDSNGRLATTKVADGIITKYEYYSDPCDANNYGRLWKGIRDSNQTNGLNITTEYKYDILGRLCEIKDPNGDTTKLKFNNLDQLEKATTPSPYNYVILLSYDKNGNRSKVERERTDANQVIQFTYDMYKNLLTTTDPLNNVTRYGYNKSKDANSITDAENHKTEQVYNERHLATKVTDANGDETLYRYNSNGKLAEIEDANGEVTSYGYDGFDRLTTITYPDSTTEVFTYDKNGNITSKTTRKGDTIQYQYDSMNRMIAKTRPGEPNTVFRYDIAGRLYDVNDHRDVSEGGGVTRFSYDRVGRVTQVTSPQAQVTSYEYNNRGLRTKLIYPDGNNVTYEYDALGRLAKVKYNGSMVASYKYDELSRRTVLTYGSDANAAYTYDIGNRLTELRNKFNSTQTQTIGYSSYDNVGNRKNMIIDSNESKYKYNKLYQLVFADYPLAWNVADVNYYYDNLANRTSTYNGSTTSYLHNKLNQYSTVASVAYSYDNNGNLTNDGTYKYYYDCENRLIDVNNASTNAHIAHYAYDYVGRRTSKTTYSGGTVTTKFCYDGDRIIAEYNGSTLLRKYVYGPGIDEPVCMINVSGTTETKYYYHFDGLGSVVALTNGSGTVVESYRYNVFGQPNTDSGIGNRFMFTGREYDVGTGLYYYRARYYDPWLGRFLQTDPIGYYDSMNLYQYCGNNPINFVDPWGLSNSWNWGWWDFVTAPIHLIYEFGAYMAWGPSEWDGSYTGIGTGNSVVGAVAGVAATPGLSEVVGAAAVGAEVGKVAIKQSDKNNALNKAAEDMPDWKELPTIPDKSDSGCPKK